MPWWAKREVSGKECSHTALEGAAICVTPINPAIECASNRSGYGAASCELLIGHNVETDYSGVGYIEYSVDCTADFVKFYEAIPELPMRGYGYETSTNSVSANGLRWSLTRMPYEPTVFDGLPPRGVSFTKVHCYIRSAIVVS